MTPPPARASSLRVLLPFSTFVIDLVVGAVFVGAVGTLLERTVLTQTLQDPVRGHLVSLFAGWVVACAVVMIMNPWRSEVPLLYAIGAIPVGWWRVKQGREERARIGHHRASRAAVVYTAPPRQEEAAADEEEEAPREEEQRGGGDMMF